MNTSDAGAASGAGDGGGQGRGDDVRHGGRADVAFDAMDAAVADGVDAARAADAAGAGDVLGDNETPGDADAAAALPVLLGTTNAAGTAWADLPDAATLTLIFGPQGGYHVWASVCVPANTTGVLQVRAELRVAASGAEVAPGPLVLKTLAKDVTSQPGWRCRLALPVFVTCACDADGVAMALHVAVTLDDGAAGTAMRLVTPEHVVGPCLPPGAVGCGGG